MDVRSLVSFATEHQPRAYVNASIRFHHLFTTADRLTAATKAGWNVFQFPSEMLQGGDLLSDSGTTTLTAEQWAAMFLGDEAYGSNYGYFQLLESFRDVFGIDLDAADVFLFHQGRAAEHALFTQIGRLGADLRIPSNGHFDTTHANIEANGMRAVNLFHPSLEEDSDAPFKGDMDTAALEKFLKNEGDRVPLVFLTVTNNTGGGQPVSLANIRAVREICDRHKKSLLFDACRFAENAWFIQEREKGMGKTLVRDIVREMFTLCDGFTISLKKDGLANMGGALVIRKSAPIARSHRDLLTAIRDHQILVEGHPTYGGMSGRDIMTAAEGLRTVIQEPYLAHRIHQVQDFGAYLHTLGIPVVRPFGGHAIYIDIDRFFKGTRMKREDFGGISLTGLLLLKGVRLCELGAFAFGTYDPTTKRETFPAHNFVRAAVPRNKYERDDLFYVADCIAGLYEQRKDLPRAVPIVGRDLPLRHFKARFRLEQ